MLLYIHGFNSSPQSHKALTLGRWLSQHAPHIRYSVPTLSPYPEQAVCQLCSIVEAALSANDCVGLVGSSLGGYYAAWLAETYRLRAVLVNPAIRPYELLGQYIGENHNYHTQEAYYFEQKHVEELRHYYIEQHRDPTCLLLMVQTGDETLDCKEATAKYFSSPNIIEYGGDHGFQGFERWFSYIIRHLRINTQS